MDDMRLDAASHEPARQPNAVAASFIGQSNPPDRPASTHRLVPPPLDQSQQRRRIRPCNIAIARKCRQYVLVAEVLRPCLVFLRRLAHWPPRTLEGTVVVD